MRRVLFALTLALASACTEDCPDWEGPPLELGSYDGEGSDTIGGYPVDDGAYTVDVDPAAELVYVTFQSEGHTVVQRYHITQVIR